MPSVDISNQIASDLYSTNVNISLLSRNFMGIETGIQSINSENQFGYVPPNDLYLDVLDPKAQRLFKSLTLFQPYQWKNDDTILNVAYKFHGTTSTAWIILATNPVTSPFDLVPGLVIRIPLIAQIQAYVNSLNTPATGTSYIAF